MKGNLTPTYSVMSSIVKIELAFREQYYCFVSGGYSDCIVHRSASFASTEIYGRYNFSNYFWKSLWSEKLRKCYF